jgi:hypothetical protein
MIRELRNRMRTVLVASIAAGLMVMAGCYYVEHVHHDYYDDYDYHHYGYHHRHY